MLSHYLSIMIPLQVRYSWTAENILIPIFVCMYCIYVYELIYHYFLFINIVKNTEVIKKERKKEHRVYMPRAKIK